MKDFLFINSGLSNEFWAEAIDTVNYLQNQLPTYTDKIIIISKKAWTRIR